MDIIRKYKIHKLFNNLIEKNLSKENNKKILFHLDMMEISYYKPSNQYYFSDSGENVLIVNGNYNSIDYIDSDYKKIYKFNKKLLKKYFRLEIENYEHTY